MITDRIKGDYAALCTLRADAISRELGRRGRPATDRDVDEADRMRAEMKDWLDRAAVAGKGRFLLRPDGEINDPRFMMDPDILPFRREAVEHRFYVDHT